MKPSHQDLLKIVRSLPTDFKPWGDVDRDEPDWKPDCSCGCKYFQELDGLLGMDWGVCSNPKSPRVSLLTFEHQGCPEFEAEEEK